MSLTHNNRTVLALIAAICVLASVGGILSLCLSNDLFAAVTVLSIIILLACFRLFGDRATPPALPAYDSLWYFSLATGMPLQISVSEFYRAIPRLHALGPIMGVDHAGGR